MRALLRFEAAGKQYPSGTGVGLTEHILGRRNPRRWALSPLDLEVTRGKSIAILGRNGSGKSTLLGLAAGTISPTSGRVERLTDPTLLFQIGTSFDEELSGAENARLELLMRGLSGRTLRDRIQVAREFSDIDDAWDEPYRTYSSGMRVRLAMAAALADPGPLLLVDEILAVGDSEFVTKCLDHFRSLRRQGASLLFVTHSETLAESLGDEAIVLEAGSEVTRGSLDDCLAAYATMTGVERLPAILPDAINSPAT